MIPTRAWQVVAAAVLALSPAASADEPAGDPWPLHIIDGSLKGADGVKLADINGDRRPDIVTGFEESGITRVFTHPGYKKVRKPWPGVTIGTTKSVEDAVFADLDRDAVHEVIACCQNHRRIFYHWPATMGEAWIQKAIPASVDVTNWMFAVPMDVDGRGSVDLIAGGQGKGALVAWFEVPGKPTDVSGWKCHKLTEASWIMSLRVADMNGDGRDDVVVSDRKNKKTSGCFWLENPGPGDQSALISAWKRHDIGSLGREVMFLTLGDLDNDGLQDCAVAVKPRELHLHRRLDGSGKKWKTTIVPIDFNTGTAKAVEIADVNGDGRNDLVVTNEHARGKHGVFWLDGASGKWKPRAISGKTLGVKYDRIEMADIDNDGDLDLLTCEESESRQSKGGLGVIWYENPSAAPSR